LYRPRAFSGCDKPHRAAQVALTVKGCQGGCGKIGVLVRDCRLVVGGDEKPAHKYPKNQKPQGTTRHIGSKTGKEKY
jgi:hypothetical protein